MQFTPMPDIASRQGGQGASLDADVIHLTAVCRVMKDGASAGLKAGNTAKDAVSLRFLREIRNSFFDFRVSL
jgi:hypothetical protein